MGIFDSNNPGISVALDVPWPANVSSGPGVQIDKTTGQWTVGLDFPDLVDGGSPATPSNIYLAGYDVALLRYEKLRLDNVIAGATGVDGRTAIGNADYPVLTSDRYLGLAASLTAIRTITLPAASAVPAGRLVTLQDETGGISDAFYLAIAKTGGDTINGGSSWILKTTRGGVTFRSNGVDAWNVLVASGRSPVADTNYTATRGDQMIVYTSISTARTVTLPAASAFQVGQRLMVIDESGSCSGTNTITVNRAGSDTINGVTSTPIGQAYGYVAVESDGVSKWTIVDTAALSSGTITSSQISDSTPLGRTDIGATRGVAGNAIYTILASDRIVVTSVAITLPRIWTLPLAGAVSAGTEITLSDEAGVATATNTVSIAPAGSDTINGVAGNQVVFGAGIRQKQSVRSDGVSNWILSSLFGALDGSPVGFTTPSTGAFTTLGATGAATLSSTLAVTGASTLTGAVTLNTAAASFLNQGRFSRASATAVQFVPHNGSMIKIAGLHYPIPSGGVDGGVALFAGGSSFVNGSGSSNLSASTFYYVYVFNNAGTLTFDFSTSAYAKSATAGNVGTMIKTGDDTRTLVGAIYTNASAITDSDTSRTVISWFNRQPKRLQNNFTAARSVSFGVIAEVNTEIRCNFIIWADDVLQASINGSSANSLTANTFTAIGVDGTQGAMTLETGTNDVPIGLSEVRSGISEGALHYITLMGFVSSGLGTWGGASIGFVFLNGSITG